MSDWDRQRGPEPVAIVGMACRMPGGVQSPAHLWDLVMSKRIANQDRVPPSRFNIDGYFHPNEKRPGSLNVSGGYFLDDDVEAFDPGLFHISPVEALWMDPQQKKLLEVTYEALENGGVGLHDVAGQKIGCFIGSFSLDYQHMTYKEPDFRHTYAATGVDPGLLANRLSHVFDLRGPSLMVNTACSSSLYALDLACKAIATGECDGAVVGGVNLILTVDQHMNTARMGVMSPTNQCHTFDVAADGYGRAEGVGALYIRSLSAAMRSGDPIRAVIRSTASNSNGRGQEGLSHPSVQGQVEVIAQAYRAAGLNPDDTAYVECHGTGTPVGDPIEVKAIADAMGKTRTTDNPVLIGSVKPNVGHSEAASSVATLIKAVLALETGVIPPTAGIVELNPHIPWSDSNVKVVTDGASFPARMPCRRIGVSAFGYAGTNVHAILESAESMANSPHRSQVFRPCRRREQAAADSPSPVRGADDEPHLLLFSAHDESTLKNHVIDMADACRGAYLPDLAYTLALRRTKLAKRAFAITRRDTVHADMVGASADITAAPRDASVLAFVFTGQGSQWPRMGARLFRTFPSFKRAMRNLDQHLSTLGNPPSWRIQDVLSEHETTGVIDHAEFAQPLCTAVQVGLVQLLSEWSVKPAATVGHSSGEIAAAYAAGFISAEQAITAAYLRGLAAASLLCDGAMLAVGLGAERAQEAVDLEASCHGQAVVACHNSPSSSTISGDRECILRLKQRFDAAKIFARLLKTDGKAYHSHVMTEAAQRLAAHLSEESDNQGSSLVEKKPFFSTVDAKAFRESEGLPDTYWARNLTSPVLFNQAVQTMLSEMPQVNTLVEIGPHPALAGPLREVCQAAGKPSVGHLATLRRGRDDDDEMLRLAGQLWARDAEIDLKSVLGVETVPDTGGSGNGTAHLLVDLPTYHWTYTHSRLAESRLSKEHRAMKEARHDILGRRVLGPSALEPMWRNVLRQQDLPWLAQHRLAGEVLMPAAGFLALALEAMTQLNAEAEEPLTIQSFTMRDVVISAATAVPDDDVGTETIFMLRPVDGKLDKSANGEVSQWYHFSSSCCSYGSWKESARGKIAINIKGAASLHRPRTLPEATDRTDFAVWLDKLRQLGFQLGPVFHRISTVYTDGKTQVSRADMGLAQDSGLMEAESRYVLHPTVLDSCLQPIALTSHMGRLEDLRCGTVPTHFGEVTIFPPTAIQAANRCVLQTRLTNGGTRALTSDCDLISEDGSLVAQISACRTVAYEAALPSEFQGHLQQDLYLKLDWVIDSEYLEWAGEAGVLPAEPLATVLDAFLHKDAASRMLCFDETLALSILSKRPDARVQVARLSSAAAARVVGFEHPFDPSAERVSLDNGAQNSSDLRVQYDLVVLTGLKDVERPTLDHVRDLVAPRGRLVLQIAGPRGVLVHDSTLKSARFSGIDERLGRDIIITTAVEPPGRLPAKTCADGPAAAAAATATLIYRGVTPCSSVSLVLDGLTSLGWHVEVQKLSSIRGLNNRQVVLLADMQGPLLFDIDSEELQSLITITETASSLIWVTPGGLMMGDRPAYGMTEGAARVIRRERPMLDLVTLDFDTETTSESRIAELIVRVLRRQQDAGRNDETEYYVKGGVPYVGRVISARDLNRQFAPDSGEGTMESAQQRPAVEGVIESEQVFFRRDAARETRTLKTNQVEVYVEAIGLSADDGADDSWYLSHEFAGTVVNIGPDVGDSLAVGTKVVGLAVGNLATFQTASASFVQPIPNGRSMVEAATIPSAFCTAAYGLEELARVGPGDGVAIVDGMGATALAAIQWCELLGVSVLFIALSTIPEEVLVGLPATCRVISGLGSGLWSRIHNATRGKGVDVLFCSTGADVTAVIECGQCLRRQGRVVTFGRANEEPRIHSSLPLTRKGLSTFHFDLVDLIQRRPQVMARLLEKCIGAFGNGAITPLGPVNIIKPPVVERSARLRPELLGAGKLVLSYENATFNVLPSKQKHPLQFKENSTYLLVGCLGGLGRQVATWMAHKGARHLAFISRSGADKPAAAETVQRLAGLGVTVTILRADVADRQRLDEAIRQIDTGARPIRGVVNAAAGLRDSVFFNMTHDAWKHVTDTKVKGCLNLHDIFKEPNELDFFIMTSSVTSMLGSSGQSNYGAANAFLDCLARHRRLRGLPSVSLVLPAILGIGYLSEHPEIEAVIRSKGMYGIREAEMLEAFEVAMAQSSSHLAIDHVIVGLQPRRFGPSLRAAGLETFLAQDARLSWMAHAVQGAESGGDAAHGPPSLGTGENVIDTIQHAESDENAIQLLTDLLCHRLARLLMMEQESLRLAAQKSITSHGLDSMVGTDFRNWILSELAVTVPLQQLLSGSLTVSELARLLCARIRHGVK